MDVSSVSSFVSLTTGTLGLLLTWCGVCIYGFVFGTARIRALALSIPIALFLFSTLPASLLSLVRSFLSEPLFAPALFGTVLLFSFFVVQRRTDSWDDRTGIVGTLLASTSLLMLALLVSYTLVPDAMLAPYYPDTVEQLFGNTHHTFWIMAIALLLLYLL